MAVVLLDGRELAVEALLLFLTELDDRHPTLTAHAIDKEVEGAGLFPEPVPEFNGPFVVSEASTLMHLYNGELTWPLKQTSHTVLRHMAIDLANQVLQQHRENAVLLTWLGRLPRGVRSADRVREDYRMGAVQLRFLSDYDPLADCFVLRADVYYAFAHRNLTAHEQELVTLLMEARNEYAALLAHHQYAAVA